MNRRVAISMLTVGAAAQFTTVLAAAQKPIGRWDEPVLFTCSTFPAGPDGAARVKALGWSASYHGKEYGELVQMTPIYTVAEMVEALKLLQTLADQQLAYLQGSQV